MVFLQELSLEREDSLTLKIKPWLVNYSQLSMKRPRFVKEIVLESGSKEDSIKLIIREEFSFLLVQIKQRRQYWFMMILQTLWILISRVRTLNLVVLTCIT